MMQNQTILIASLRVILLIAALVAGSFFPGMTASSALAQTPPESDWELVFHYDFSNLELGELQEASDLTVTNPRGERGRITVVADAQTSSGRALQVATNRWPNTPRPSMSVRFPKWDIPSADVEVIAYEYKLKYESGSAGMYLYANQGGNNHRIILRPVSEQNLIWTATLDGNTSTTVDALRPGWNTIRVIADRTTRSGDLYINDMKTPVATSLPLQRPVETWEDMIFIITHETNANEIREAYYADIKVWAVD